MPQSWFVIELTSDYVDPGEPPPVEEAGRSGERTLATAGTWFEEFEERFAGSTSLARQYELRLPSLVPSPAVSFEHRVQGAAQLKIEFEQRVSGIRLPADRWQKLLREDEEILLFTE
jgi:hypothetical protein